MYRVFDHIIVLLILTSLMLSQFSWSVPPVKVMTSQSIPVTSATNRCHLSPS